MSDRKAYMKQWHKENKKQQKEYHEQWYIKNKEYQKIYMKQYRIDNKKKVAIINKRWRELNPENHKRWYLDNHEKIAIYHKYYSRTYKTQRNKQLKRKRKTDLKFNLNQRISKEIYFSLKGNKAGRHWEDLVGYTLNDLRKHLEKTLPDGYTWAKCHIDHIIPKSAFNYTKPEHPDFKRCWALENLRLLPAKENMVKHDKLEKPFQPALKIIYEVT